MLKHNLKCKMYANLWRSLTMMLIALNVSAANNYYTAAVFEHALDFTAKGINGREDALKVMESNLVVLEEQVHTAKEKMTDIFVFPEYGLYGRIDNRKTASFYTEMIPDPTDGNSFCPCLDGPSSAGQEVLHRLSCIASNNSIYIAANMGDKQSCQSSLESRCQDGYFLYNTEVVFNKTGCLVARYHKQNLFEVEKLIWDMPINIEYSVFETDFGKFGLMVCFDAVFKEPAITLVEEYNVTDIIFSTAWMNVYPHYISVPYHSGWARNMKVNFLASNIHNVKNRLVGSGIYGPDGIINYTFNITSPLGTVVIAQIPVINKSKQNENSTSKQQTNIVNFVSNNQLKTFNSEVFADNFTFTFVQGLGGNVTVCSGVVCCSLEYSRSNSSELYALGVFNGMHVVEGEYYFEICLLTRCNQDYSDCGGSLANSTETIFYNYSLTGSMPTRYVFPEVVPSDLDFKTGWEYTNSGSLKSIKGSAEQLHSVVLMGRNFDKDPFNWK